MTLDAKTFAVALLAHRMRLGLTQPEAAALCEISPRLWWKWEHGEGNPLPVTMEGMLTRLKKATPPR